MVAFRASAIGRWLPNTNGGGGTKVRTARFMLYCIGFAVLAICVVVADVGEETHGFTGLPITAEGWTDLLAMFQNSSTYNDSRVVYVSTSGNDATAVDYQPGDAAIGSDPFNPPGTVAPYATLDAAYERLRDGYPDLMLLRRGDTWDTDLPTWEKSGRSPTERMILGAYGPLSQDRPKTGSLIGRRGFDFVIVADLELGDIWRAVHLEGPFNHVLIEGCYMPPATVHGMVLQNPDGIGGVDYFALRRCVIAGRHRPSGIVGYVQGMYIDDAINLLLEENIFDDNGRDEFGVPNSTSDLRSHNTYVMLGHGNGENHIWRYNISSRASSHGFQAGNGGVIIANLSVQNPIALQTAREDAWYTGVSAAVTQNVILHGIDVSADNRRGWGILITNADEQLVADNIIAQNIESGQVFGILTRNATRSGVEMSVNDVVIQDNIVYNWNGENVIDGEQLSLYGPRTTNVTLDGNRFHATNPDIRVIQTELEDAIVTSADNAFYGTISAGDQFNIGGIEYDLDGYKAFVGDTTSTADETTPSGDVSLPGYLTSIGEVATFDSFYETLRQQRKGNWDNRYMAVPIINYIRTRFGREEVAPTYAWMSLSLSMPANLGKPSGLRLGD